MPRTHRRRLAAALSGVLVATMTLPAMGATTTDVAADADWIMSARFSDGAIANYVDRQAVWPYLSNFAAMGLARATKVTGNTTYLQAAWAWLSWYQAHENSSGFVTDYRLVNGVLTSTNDMDSTDSYAGTFLLAAREAYRVNNGLTKLKGLANGIAGAVRAIEATQDADGLTWAKPAWHVKYLMDQAEVYAGLLAAVDMANAIGNSTLAQQASADAARMKKGVDALWNPLVAAYDWAVHDTGARQATGWNVIYSDSLQQAWAVAFGLVDGTRSPTLLTKLNTAQPNWHLPAATALFDNGATQTVGYWPVAGWAFNAINSAVSAGAALDIRAAALSAGRAWPFTTGNAGQLILFETNYSLPLATSTTTGTPSSTTSTTTTTVKPATAQATTTTIKPTTTTAKPATTSTTAKPTTTTTALVSAAASVSPPSASGSVTGT
ncbi:MAG TPA: hypothetical protein VJ456_19135, partial [Acidimicrobiia bacterium]|nr:hypothetical protein [Acidimicrobiia bacterium]